MPIWILPTHGFDPLGYCEAAAWSCLSGNVYDSYCWDCTWDVLVISRVDHIQNTQNIS